ncbi:MAG: DHH family phosphoesterase [Bacteroidia bacterium]|nr:MAG: DHH family phosphoesterase [Bacteroidia bacterium]
MQIVFHLSESFKALFQPQSRIVITGHYNPDGDAIGSALALYYILKQEIPNVQVIMPNPPPEFLSWLPGFSDMLIFNKNREEAKKKIAQADIIFSLDYNKPERVEFMKDDLLNSSAIKVMIDHHLEPGDFADHIFSFPGVSSTAELMLQFIREMDKLPAMNKDIATCLYTGIMTDTINFSVSGTTIETFAAAADLLMYGIDKNRIYNKTFNNYAFNRLKMTGYLLYQKLQRIPGTSAVLMIFTLKEMEQFDYRPGDHEGIVNMPLSVADVSISIIALERDGFVKLSLRSIGSDPKEDVNKLARSYFNGGGHQNASGGKLFIGIEKAEKRIIYALQDFFRKNK